MMDEQMEKSTLTKLYMMHLARQGRRSRFLDHYLLHEGYCQPTQDDYWNEGSMLENLDFLSYSGPVGLLLEVLYKQMTLKAFDDSQDIIDGIMFVQNVIALALWKYRIDVCVELDVFARDFDRLDNLDERRRLYDAKRI